MKTRLTLKRHIKALFTNDAESTARLMKEGEKIRIPDKILKQATDMILTVFENIKSNEEDFDRASIIAAYVLRYAYLLNRDKEFVEAPPLVKYKNKEKLD